MNRDEPEKLRKDTIGDGIDLMRSDMEWKGVAAHRAELAEMRNDLIGNGTEKNRGESAESRNDRSGNGKDKKSFVLRRKRDAQRRSELKRNGVEQI